MSERGLMPQIWSMSWGIPGAAACAGLAFWGYFEQPGLNADTFAHGLFALGAGLAGLFAGTLLGTLSGQLLTALLQRVGGPGWLTGLAGTLLNAGLWWGVYVAVHAALPGWLHPAPAAPQPPPAVAVPACKMAPPADPKERRLWDEECRP
jgi:hypothetical protein